MARKRTAPRLRPHHFICLQFYRGEGYDQDFIDSLNTLLAYAAARPAVVVEGADDVCAACPHLAEDSRCESPDAGEDEIARIDAIALALLGVSSGDQLSLPEAERRLRLGSAMQRWREQACSGCAWEDVCATRLERVAQGQR